jgi:hypothetical protein
MFYPKDCSTNCMARTRCVRAAFIKKYPQLAASTPLLELDVTNWKTPFAVAPTEDPNARCIDSGEYANECRQACAASRDGPAVRADAAPFTAISDDIMEGKSYVFHFKSVLNFPKPGTYGFKLRCVPCAAFEPLFGSQTRRG